MRRADRLFQLVHLLRARKFATSEELAKELGVSRRTVYRDIKDLERSGVPIRGEAGVGYAMQRGYELPPLTFNAEEIEALALGARMVEAWTDPDLAAASRTAMTKVEAVLPEPLRAILLDTPLFAIQRSWAAYATKGMTQVRRAIADHHKLRFGYTRADGQSTIRTVRPVGLYFWGSTWSLAAWCELRDDYRSFRPDRMENLAVLPEQFEPDGEVSLQAFLARMEDREAM